LNDPQQDIFSPFEDRHDIAEPIPPVVPAIETHFLLFWDVVKLYTQGFHLIFPPMVSECEFTFGPELLKAWLVLEDGDERI
jgi:hypothetical protein